MQTVIRFVCFHAPAVKFPSGKIGVLMLPHLFNAPTDAANLGIVVGEHIGGIRPALVQMPGLRHFLLQFGDLLRRQTGAALQSLILTEIGVDGFHGFLRRFQFDELGFQLCRRLRVVHADTAHACAADLVQNSLNILPFLHIAVTGGVLLLFLANGEIAAACNEDRGNTGFNGIVVVQIFRQLAGVGVQQRVNFLMVHGIDALFLPLRNRRCLIYHLPIFGGGAACGVVAVAVCIVGTAGSALIDGVIPDGGLLRRGICGRRFLRLLLYVGGLLLRLVAIGGIFLHGHACGFGFLCDLTFYMGFVVLKLFIKIGKLRWIGQVIIARVQLFPASVHMGKNRMKICCLLRRQGFSIFQHIRSGALLLGEIAMQPHIRYKLGEKRFTLGLVLFPRFRALVVQHKVFPVFVLGVVFVIGLDMVDQSAVPVAKVLPSLVAVTFPVKCAVNAEFGFIVPAACIARLLTLGTLFIVQCLKKCVGAGKRELFTLLQLIALAPNNRHDRLYRRIKGGRFLAGHFLLVVEHGNLLVAGIGQVVKFQIVQLALDQRSQRFILSTFNQHITQIFFNAEVRQVCVCLNGDFIIRNGRVSNTNGGQVAEICIGMKFFAAVIVNQLFRKLQFSAPPCGVAQMQRVKAGSRGKADVVENIVHITFFQRSGCVVILPRGRRAYAAGCNVVIQACF